MSDNKCNLHRKTNITWRATLGVLMTLMNIIFALPTLAKAEEVTLPSGTKASEIDAIIDAYVKEHEATTAAVSVAVFSGDKTLMEKAYGYVNVEDGLANNGDSVFEWGSCSKLIIWASVMQLVEDGKLNLEEDIKTYLPKGFLRKLEYDTPITMLNLMNHNAGWQETITDLFLSDLKDVKELGDTLRYIEPEQIFEPGTVVAYSNWGTALAAYIVELVSGETYSEYVKKNVFQPLEMEHTAIAADLSDNPWVLEQRLKQNCYRADKTSLGTAFNYIPLYPCGMVTGTISDFVKFAKAFVPSGGSNSPLFDRNTTLEQMLSPSLYYADGELARNCHGFWTDKFMVPVLWHNGGTIGSTTWFAFHPESGVGVVILTNQSGESTYTCGILPKIFGAYQYQPMNDQTTDPAGVYASARTCIKGFAKLYSLLNTIKLVPSDTGSYVVPGSDIQFINIAKDTYVMDMGGLKQQVVQIDHSEDGKDVLQVSATDYLKANSYALLGQVGLLVGFAAAAIFCFVSLIILAIKALRKNSKKPPLMLLKVILNVAVIAVMILSVYLAVTLFSGTSMLSQVRWNVMLIGLLACIPVVYVIVMILKLGKKEYSIKQKAGLIIHGLAGLLMTAYVLYWDIYRFW